MKFKRFLNLDLTLRRKSLFLLGARQTGKSTFLIDTYPDAHFFDLLDPANFRKFKSDLNLFKQEIDYFYQNKNNKIFIVDEIQKIPELLDEIHRQIELHKNIRFILTGSSARKLKRSGVNMLGGRASRFYFHPITSSEIGIALFCDNLNKILNYGTIPSIYLSDSPWEDLKDYVDLYLREEIHHEAIIRNLEGFSRFLNVAALTNAEQINFASLGSDAQVPPRTVREYYQVLEDTLIGRLLPAFTETIKRKAMTSTKFYFFDPGITNALLNRSSVSAKTHEFGNQFEQMIFCELMAFLDYNQLSNSIFYWRSTSKFEVDFIIKLPDQGHNQSYIAIEIKSSSLPNERDLKGLRALSEEKIYFKRKLLVCLGDTPRKIDDIEILPLKDFLELLWENNLII